MEPVVVRGSFATEDGYKVEGVVAFIPERLWVMQGTVALATYSAVQELDNGQFEVELTPTDSGYTRWRYKAITPAGIYKIKVPAGGPHFLKDLIALSKSRPTKQ